MSYSYCLHAGAPKAKSSSSVQALDPAGVVSFISARPQLASRVGPPGSEGEWTVKEVGDGNINFVYIVQVRSLSAWCIRGGGPGSFAVHVLQVFFYLVVHSAPPKTFVLTSGVCPCMLICVPAAPAVAVCRVHQAVCV